MNNNNYFDSNNYILKTNKIKLRNEVDRYGFSYQLAKKIGFQKPPRAFCGWSHGWAFYKPVSFVDLYYTSGELKNRIVVATKQLDQFLVSQGAEKVVAGGLPFAYINKSNCKRISDSIVFFPPHSGSSTIQKKAVKSYFEYIYEQEKSFEFVAVCASGIDYELFSKYGNHKVKIIYGAESDDSNSLLRIRNIFDTFDFVSTNVMGSHVLYASYCGCKVSICGDMYKYTFNEFHAENGFHNNIQQIERFLLYFSESYIKKRHPHFFVSNPRQGREFLEWSKIEIGAENILSNQKLIDVLGWSISGQIYGYLKGIKRRLFVNL